MPSLQWNLSTTGQSEFNWSVRAFSHCLGIKFLPLKCSSFGNLHLALAVYWKQSQQLCSLNQVGRIWYYSLRRQILSTHSSEGSAEENILVNGWIPMVVMTVPAKKKALPRSQWLLLLEEFPTGLTPALSASSACCKERESTSKRLINCCIAQESVRS